MPVRVRLVNLSRRLGKPPYDGLPLCRARLQSRCLHAVEVRGLHARCRANSCCASAVSTTTRLASLAGAGVPLLDGDYLILSTIHSAKGTSAELEEERGRRLPVPPSALCRDDEGKGRSPSDGPATLLHARSAFTG